eukprot:COSAG02_NODE_59106_length_275_cov_0.590909_1_plen_42_part_10
MGFKDGGTLKSLVGQPMPIVIDNIKHDPIHWRLNMRTLREDT